MCYFFNRLYVVGSIIYYKFKVFFAHVEELGVELEVIPVGIVVEKFEIIGPIILWTEDLESG